MNIQKDALLQIVKAARLSIKLAENMKAMMMEENSWTVADVIAGHLEDALFFLSGEKLAMGEDFMEKSTTMRLLTGDLSDESVCNWLFMMDSIRKKHLTTPEVQQPKPQTMSKEDVHDLYRMNGGYMSPEGEWI